MRFNNAGYVALVAASVLGVACNQKSTPDIAAPVATYTLSSPASTPSRPSSGFRISRLIPPGIP